jgi:hypothetical protein
MNNQKIFGMMLISASILLVTTGYQSALASSNAIAEEIQVEETTLSENTTMMNEAMNQTLDGDTTGTNSTS